MFLEKIIFIFPLFGFRFYPDDHDTLQAWNLPEQLRTVRCHVFLCYCFCKVS